MAWIPVHQTLLRHRKMIVLASALKMPRQHMAGCLIALWTWAIDNAPSGEIGDLPVEVIAFGGEWEGDAGEFYDALQRAGFVDATGKIHDWEEYAGKLINQRTANADRMKKARAAHVQRTSETRAETKKPRAANVRRQSTVENSREEKSTQEEDTFIAAAPRDTETPPVALPVVADATHDEPPKEPRRDLLFEALCSECGIDWRNLTTTERGRINTATKQIRGAGGTPDDVPARAANYRAHWDTTLTPMALAGNWGVCAKPPERRERSNGKKGAEGFSSDDAFSRNRAYLAARGR